MARRRLLNAGIVAAFLVGVPAIGSWAVGPPVEKVVHEFSSTPDGTYPLAPLIADSQGNLYGTAVYGGLNYFGYGVVFELSPNQDGTWTENILYSFTNTPDGAFPWAKLTFDSAGNLYGTTQGGGYASGYEGAGTVFKLAPSQGGGWTETVIYTFGDSAADPESSGVIIDQAGNLYGTTTFGGTSNCGAVYQLSPGQDGTWTANILHNFSCGRDGATPYGGLVMDANGNLYGTTYEGGRSGSCSGNGCGTVFELSPQAGGGWSGTQLYAFSGGRDGASPTGTLVLDAAGNLYGTTYYGGLGQGRYGVVYMLSPSSGERWKITVLHSYPGYPEGSTPNGDLVFDSAGNLYGTTQSGPAGSGGTVFRLSPESGVGLQYQSFPLVYGDGYLPEAGVVLDSFGNVYGTASEGGIAYPYGTVFEIKPSQHR